LTFAAFFVGYAIGSIPTAQALGRLWGVDLRIDGSRNPGANNAARLGGPVLAALVLLIEMGKGGLAVVLGLVMGGEAGAVAGGVGAVVGNVYNIWYRFGGGKGLGITAGVLLLAWPTVVIPILVVLAMSVYITRSSGTATLVSILVLNVFAVVWSLLDWPMAWGIGSTYLLSAMSLGIGITLWAKHRRDSRVKSPLPH
jgi:glycerol-3-phosphate acyltransferase PlsY